MTMSDPDWRITLPNGRHVVVSTHALDRWHEHVCPGRDRGYAMRFLRQMAAREGVLDRPDWIVSDPDDGPQIHLSIGDFVVVIALADNNRPPIAVTVIARGGLLPADRKARRDARHDRRRHRRAHSPTGQQDARSGDRRRRRDRQAPNIDTDL